MDETLRVVGNHTGSAHDNASGVPVDHRFLENVAVTSHAQAEMTVGFSNNDLVMIDNVKLLEAPMMSRLQTNLVAFCTKGRMQAELNGTTTRFEENQILACPSNCSFTNIMVSPDFMFKALFISNRMLHDVLMSRMSSWADLLYVRKKHVAPLGEVEIDFLIRFYEMLKVVFDSPDDYPFKAEIIESILRGGFLSLLGFLKTQFEVEDIPPTERKTTEMVFQQFLDSLANHTAKHRTVEYYAKELCVTPKYLSAACKSHSSKTANAWIREYVVEDIRYYLSQTNISIKEICALLGFPNPSFFGRYVKEHFGKSPSQIRKGFHP